MRVAALGLVLVLSAPLLAQPGPFLAEVTAESVPVRAGPSDQLPETGMLFRGAKVVVAHEDGDQWVAIQPPRGQVSWIRGVHLGPVEGQAAAVLPRNAVVHAEPEAELAVGRPGHDRPLDLRRTRVPDRTILLVIGNKVEHNGVWWYPVEPPDGDVRYVPKSAVRFLRAQPAQSFVVRSPDPPAVEPAGKLSPELPTASVPNRLPGGPRPDGWPSHPLWQQAEQASRSGDLARAEQLYLKLAAEMNQPGGDAELANLCYTRVHAVRERQRQGPRGGSPAEPAVPAGKWVGPGGLRLAGFRYEGRTTYALVDPQGQLRCYAVAAAGVDLERFRGTEVDLFGTTAFPGELRGVGVMTVTRVQAVRER